MKLYSLFGSVILFALLLAGCNNKSGQPAAGKSSGLSVADSMVDGEKSIYSENGKLHYKVEYKNGKANGRVREYRSDGTLYMDAVFKDGHRDGKCTCFFKSGSVYSVTFYVDGKREGTETKYYEDGKIQSTNTYYKDKVLPGLKEFNRDGTEIKENVSIVIKEEDLTKSSGKFYLHVTLSDIGKNASFYASTNPEGPREKLIMKGNTGTLEIPVTSRNFMLNKLIIDAEYMTSRRNTMRIQKFYKIQRRK
jgi:hypothetical protein